jgi:hypothetical protein
MYVVRHPQGQFTFIIAGILFLYCEPIRPADDIHVVPTKRMKNLNLKLYFF